jgi:hypothetical protein
MFLTLVVLVLASIPSQPGSTPRLTSLAPAPPPVMTPAPKPKQPVELAKACVASSLAWAEYWMAQWYCFAAGGASQSPATCALVNDRYQTAMALQWACDSGMI